MQTWLQTSVRAKIIIIIVLGILITDSFIYLASQTFILNGYETIERNQIVRNLQQANDAFQNRLTQMAVKIRDWATWDDSYNFATNPTKSNFIEETIGISSIPDLQDLDVAVFVDSAGKHLYAQTRNSAKDVGANNPLVQGLLEEKRLLIPAGTITKEGTQGVISLEQPILTASSPILPSSGEGAAAGTLIFGKTIDDDLVTKMSALTHLSLKGFMYDAPGLPADVLDAREKLSVDNNYVVQPLSSNRIAGYTSLYDLNNSPTYIIRIDRTRDIYQQGQSTIRWFLIFTSAALLVCGAATALFIEMFVIFRLKRLSRTVSQIGENRDAEIHVDAGGYRDDVGQLAGAINDMFNDLSRAREKEIILNSSGRDMAQNIKDRFEEVSRLNRKMIERELEMSELKQTIHALEKRIDANKSA